MVELSHRDRIIKVKIVYYGPPVGGKTTNLQVLHRHAEATRRGEMVSVNSAQDRTILFDLLPLKTPGFRGFDLRLQLLAVPGQAMYSATRRLVLKGADAVVFVANSAVDRFEENLQSYREMTQNLLTHHLDPASVPMVFQYNKRDLPQVTDTEVLDRALNGRKSDAIPAVAVSGEGVLETFAAILHRTMQDLARRYSILDRTDGQPAWQWTQQAVEGLFGSTTITEETLSEDDIRPPRRSVSLKPMPPLEPGASGTGDAIMGAALPPLVTPPVPNPALSVAGPLPAPPPAPAPGGPIVTFSVSSPALPPSPASSTELLEVDVADSFPPGESALPEKDETGEATEPHRGFLIADPSAALRSAFGSSEPDRPAPSAMGLLYFEDDLAEEAAEPPPVLAPAPVETRAPAEPSLELPVAPAPDEGAVWIDLEQPAAPPDSRPMPFEGVMEEVERPRGVVRVTPQPTDSLLSLPESKATSALVESYAEAAQQLGAALSEMREERDLALGRLEDLRRSVEAARDIAAGEALGGAAEAILRRMSDAVEASHASLLVPRADGSLEAAVLRGLLRDPVLASPAAVAAVRAALGDGMEAILLEASGTPALEAAINRGDPTFDGVVAVPLRTPRGLFGLALLFLTADAARPTEAALEHLVELARAVALSLELATTLGRARQSERALEMALTGSASVHGLEGLVGALLELRNRLGDMRRRPDAPAWFLDDFARCGPFLSTALGVARSLVAFSKGEIEHETVDLGDLLAEIRSDAVLVEASGQEQVLGDSGLLRVALRALVDHVGGGSAPVVVQVAPAPGRVLVGVGLRGPAPAIRSEDSLGLPLVRRIAALHGGSVEVERVADSSDWVFLSLPPA